MRRPPRGTGLQTHRGSRPRPPPCQQRLAAPRPEEKAVTKSMATSAFGLGDPAARREQRDQFSPRAPTPRIFWSGLRHIIPDAVISQNHWMSHKIATAPPKNPISIRETDNRLAPEPLRLDRSRRTPPPVLQRGRHHEIRHRPDRQRPAAADRAYMATAIGVKARLWLANREQS